MEKWDRLNSGITPRIRGVPEFGMGARIHDLPNSGTPPPKAKFGGWLRIWGARVNSERGPNSGGWVCGFVSAQFSLKTHVWWGEGLHPKGIDASETDGDVKTEARKCYDCEK